MNAEETKRWKAMNLRYKKPIGKDLNLDAIKEALCEIGDECDDVQYYLDYHEETLLNALDGDEDDAYEFRMMFSDLSAECDQMWEDLRKEYVPEYFDLFFVAVGKGYEMVGYDVYEHDYFGLDYIESEWANEEAVKKMKALTKDQLIKTAQYCFKIFQAYIGLQHRYDCIKAAMDILRDSNTGYLQMVDQIEKQYEKANESTDGFKWWSHTPEVNDLDRLIENMPQEVWLQ